MFLMTLLGLTSNSGHRHCCREPYSQGVLPLGSSRKGWGGGGDRAEQCIYQSQ